MKEIKGLYTSAKLTISELDESTINQIQKFVNHEAFTNDIVIMPDAHAGIGSCIGFTMKLTDKIIPNIIGVDIGCGVLSMNIKDITVIKTNNIPFYYLEKDSIKGKSYSLEKLDKKIRETVPFGMNIHGNSVSLIDVNKSSLFWHRVNSLAENFYLKYKNDGHNIHKPPHFSVEWLMNKCEQIGVDYEYVINSIGTLGGGNHFIEFGVSKKSGLWVTVHSGSRNLGAKIAKYWQSVAANTDAEDKRRVFNSMLKKYKIEHKDDLTSVSDYIKELKNKLALEKPSSTELAYLQNENAYDYLYDMLFAQEYASLNRSTIIMEIYKILCRHTKTTLKINETISSVHNYINFNDNIIRKGSISSYKEQKMMIPLNMEDGILICEGKSNSDWNYSAPHGAGRVFSRKQANATLSLEKAKKSMEKKGIFSSEIPLDEVKEAYKKSELIEKSIADTATIIDRIIPVHNLKAK